MNIKRYTPLNCGFYPFAHVVECGVGEFVCYNDYNSLNNKYQELNTDFDKLQKEKEHLEIYTDHLVSFSKLPCLPKDLENLRESNIKFAEEIHSLQERIRVLNKDIISWKNKWECAVELAAVAENKIKHISEYLNN